MTMGSEREYAKDLIMNKVHEGKTIDEAVAELTVPTPAPVLEGEDGYHSRLPWEVVHFNKDGADEWTVCTTGKIKRTVVLANTNDARQAKADVQLIVTRVNSFPTLVAALRRIASEECFCADYVANKEPCAVCVARGGLSAISEEV